MIRKKIPTVIDRGLKVRGVWRRLDDGEYIYRGPIAAKKIREYATTVGYDLSAHRGVQCTQEDVNWADVILYMDDGNLRRLQEMFTVNCLRICLASYISEVRIHDPNYTPAGPTLDDMLNKIVKAAEAATNALADRLFVQIRKQNV